MVPATELFVNLLRSLQMPRRNRSPICCAAVFGAVASIACGCLRLYEVGVLSPGKWADFNVFEKSPWEDIANTHSLESVWIAGSRVPDKASAGGSAD